jgi:hypothetical protein
MHSDSATRTATALRGALSLTLGGATHTHLFQGIMFLVEAAMGTPAFITKDDPRLKKAPVGTDSVVAVGRVDPDPAGDRIVKLDGHDVTVPAGAIALSKTAGAEASTFIQSEHLIYEESQVRNTQATRLPTCTIMLLHCTARGALADAWWRNPPMCFRCAFAT